MTGPVEVVVGVVARPHGVRGEVNIELRTDEPDSRFRPGTVLRDEASARTVTVASARQAHDGFLVRFVEADDRTAAEALRGMRLVLEVPPDETPQEPGEYYDRQLVGLTVLDAAGAVRGRVAGVVHLPSQDLLEIAIEGAGVRLVPFVEALVPEVDLTGGVVRLADVRGLLVDDEGE